MLILDKNWHTEVNMLDSFFYSQVEKKEINSLFFQKLEEYAIKKSQQTYVITNPLGERKYEYDYKEALVLLLPNHKIILLDFGEDEEEFEDYTYEFVEDLGYISDKYDYREVLGRPRKWKKDFIATEKYNDIKDLEISEFLAKHKLQTTELKRNGEFLISLLTGSINDVDRIKGGIPDTLLDKIKKKIILFDGDQTRFIYQEPFQSRITIQGLAGTGKTELLLHKLKDLYTQSQDSKIAFTCHNKILSKSLKSRIPNFFDFMKVDEQIKWNERLWCMNTWGSRTDRNSGLYSYICNYYNITFQRYSYHTTFESVCRDALDKILELEDFKPCFDYILIDESQDFSEAFFKLCEKVTKKTVYVAGDIFQNVFDNEIISSVAPDFLLNKCYRTDPKTLMFAHGIGMGLFEKKLRWLNDKEWEACGYFIEKENNIYNLRRHPLRRFEDLTEESNDSVQLISLNKNQYANKIINIIDEIIEANPTVQPDDIGVMFLENSKNNYLLADTLEVLIKEKFNWDINKGYESKTRLKKTLFISNKNNVKGLEFPFVICIVQDKVTRSFQDRNSIYMMLTRSFLKSYFLLSKEGNEDLIPKLEKGIRDINHNNYLLVEKPSLDEEEKLRNAIITQNKLIKSHKELVEEIMDEIGVEKPLRARLHNMVNAIIEDDFDRIKIYDLIEANYRIISSSGA